MIDLKKEAAQKAASFIRPNTVVGLGDGSTIAHVASFLNEKIKQGLAVQLLTSSFNTQQLLIEYGLDVQPINHFSTIDIYIDGCDQFDRHLNALKSGSGIHTREKLVAQMAEQFILVGEEKKLVDKFDPHVPLVIELLPDAATLISTRIKNRWPQTKLALRENKESGKPVTTAYNNLLLDVLYEEWPSCSEVNDFFRSITGVVEISLFYQIATEAIVAGPDGVRVIASRFSDMQAS
jgi:ribose 5-phosphate isomerase A